MFLFLSLDLLEHCVVIKIGKKRPCSLYKRLVPKPCPKQFSFSSFLKSVHHL